MVKAAADPVEDTTSTDSTEPEVTEPEVTETIAGAPADEEPSTEDGTTTHDEATPLSDDEYVARVRAGYGQDCATCGNKMLGGQGLTLNDERAPIHRFCA